ncbi:hypothetical protein ACJJTC_012635 [Scirpophaga incertulas]
MLSRLPKCKTNFRFIVRFFSDKSSENDGKCSDSKTNPKDMKQRSSDSSKEKIQDLLKLMLSESKISEKEYRDKFVTAPEKPPKVKKESGVIETKTEKIEESITKAAGEVAQALGGDIKQTESELLSKVLGKINKSSTSLSDILIGMKVDRSKETDEPQPTRGQQVRRIVDKARDLPTMRYQTKNTRETKPWSMKNVQETISVSLHSNDSLGIFTSKEANYGTQLDVWETLQERQLTLATTQPPTNYFEKMIQWTEQGKVWKFPINNEQGLEQEQNVHFSEHVFLDAHLEGWCPTRGPVRHFMELVCTGLSKNAFYTIQEKKDHIMWYKEYFESKKSILKEVGVWDVSPKSSTTTT